MSGQHTPGPWEIDWNISRLDIHASGQLVATLRRSTKDGAPTYDDAEAKANAGLIAAAPDLLEALRGALKALEAIGYEMTVGDRYTNAGQYLTDALIPAREAIDRASGGKP